MLVFVIFGNKVHSYPLLPNYTGYVFLYTGQCFCKRHDFIILFNISISTLEKRQECCLGHPGVFLVKC